MPDGDHAALRGKTQPDFTNDEVNDLAELERRKTEFSRAAIWHCRRESLSSLRDIIAERIVIEGGKR